MTGKFGFLLLFSALAFASGGALAEVHGNWGGNHSRPPPSHGPGMVAGMVEEVGMVEEAGMAAAVGMAAGGTIAAMGAGTAAGEAACG